MTKNKKNQTLLKSSKQAVRFNINLLWILDIFTFQLSDQKLRLWELLISILNLPKSSFSCKLCSLLSLLYCLCNTSYAWLHSQLFLWICCFDMQDSLKMFCTCTHKMNNFEILYLILFTFNYVLKDTVYLLILMT